MTQQSESTTSGTTTRETADPTPPIAPAPSSFPPLAEPRPDRKSVV